MHKHIVAFALVFFLVGCWTKRPVFDLTTDTGTASVDSGQTDTDTTTDSSATDSGQADTDTLTDTGIAECVPAVFLNQASPAGIGTPGVIEALRFDLTAAGEKCADITVSQLTFKVIATDNASSGWITDMTRNFAVMIDLTTGEVGEPRSHWSVSSLTLADPFIVTAGSTHVFSLTLDTAGASTAEDDSIRADLVDVEWKVNGVLVNAAANGLPVTGNTLTY